MIHGGYILKARKILESELMDKPPLWSKLWDWMLLRAEWRTGAKLERGQFLTSVDDMREAMSWLVGYRRVTPTKDEIRSAYEGFTKAAMVTTTKTTRGMIVTITNYCTYQTPENYEARNEARDEKDAKPAMTPYDSKEEKESKNKKKEKDSFVESSDELRLATHFYQLILANKPDFKKPNLQKWAEHVGYMIRLDKRTPEDIQTVMEWVQADNTPRGNNGFCWAVNVLSTAKLREKFDSIEMKMPGGKASGGGFDWTGVL